MKPKRLLSTIAAWFFLFGSILYLVISFKLHKPLWLFIAFFYMFASFGYFYYLRKGKFIGGKYAIKNKVALIIIRCLVLAGLVYVLYLGGKATRLAWLVHKTGEETREDKKELISVIIKELPQQKELMEERAASLRKLVLKELNSLSLPSKTLSEEGLPKVEEIIIKALGIISTHFSAVHGELRYSAQLLETYTEQSSLVEGLLCLESWLNKQKCIANVKMPLREASGKFAVVLLTSFPAKANIGIDFKMKRKTIKTYNLVLDVGESPSLHYVDLEESD